MTLSSSKKYNVVKIKGNNVITAKQDVKLIVKVEIVEI